MSEGRGRPVQPKCTHCGKALYKRMDPGGVKTSDPYGWCRNASCEAYNTDQSGESRFAPIGGEAKAPEAKPKKAPEAKAKKGAKKAKAKKGAAEAAEAAEAVAAAVGAKPKKGTKKPAAAPAPDESPAVEKARGRIAKALEAVEKTYSKHVIGLTLAIVSQEMGSHEAANALIAEYDLKRLYGIEPRQ